MTDEAPVANDHQTRRERRVARSRGRRSAALAGWLGYGAGVFVVITIAAWLAVGAAVTPEPEPVARTTRTSRPEVALPDVTTTTPGGGAAPVAPVAVAEIPTTTTTSTTVPVLTAADTSGTTTPTP